MLCCQQHSQSQEHCSQVRYCGWTTRVQHWCCQPEAPGRRADSLLYRKRFFTVSHPASEISRCSLTGGELLWNSALGFERERTQNGSFTRSGNSPCRKSLLESIKAETKLKMGHTPKTCRTRPWKGHSHTLRRHSR